MSYWWVHHPLILLSVHNDQYNLICVVFFEIISYSQRILKKKIQRTEMLTIVWQGCLPQFSIMADEDIYYVYSAGFFSQREVITLVL